jgi:ADP-ribose pyrophosphatase YjhB (NUDIX family)
MPLCGFNDKMLTGLNDFNEGLVEHGLIYRGKQKGESLEQGIRREISDMARLQPELLSIKNVPKRIITQGIVTYASGFYMIMKQKELTNNPEKYKKFTSGINHYFKQMDDKYYGQLEGKPNDMEDLATFLNKIEL